MHLKSTVIMSLAGAAAGLIMVGQSANADIIEARFNSVEPGKGAEYSVDGGANYSDSKAGYYNWTRLGGDYAGPGADGEFITFCIEVTQNIGYGNEYEFIVADPSDAPIPGSGMGDAKALLMAELFGRHYSDSFNNDDAYSFQAAVWEIVMDDGLALDDGDFRIRNGGAALDTAQDWLDSLDGTGQTMQLAAMTSASVQDQLFIVPSPASGMLAAAGLLLVGTRRRRA
ncbi:MAG: hypothetical protein D8M59_04935 [Planctomycetes bacterium]|nr:hypothetical protein [Planctomycetota bacterium]NOG55853.1 hypothetical protein [Planctomycetota bacterium]